jgi:hypothetical protein
MQTKRLIAVWLIALAVLAAAEVAVRSAELPDSRNWTEQLLDYQIAKARGLSDGVLLFAGDSCLGNAVDSDTASEMLGRPVANLALAGSITIKGDLLILREALAHSSPQEVVIMHTPDAWSRKPRRGVEAHAQRRFTGDETAPLPWRIASNLALARGSRLLKRMCFGARWGITRPVIPEDEESVIQNDYVRQHKAASWSDRPARGLLQFSSGPENDGWLHATLRMCVEAKIPVTIVGGTLRARVVECSAEYLQEMDAWVRSIAAEYPGTRVAWTMPTSLPDEMLGDTNDHLRPDLKSTYTRWLIGRLYGAETRSFLDFVGAEGRAPGGPELTH